MSTPSKLYSEESDTYSNKTKKLHVQAEGNNRIFHIDKGPKVQGSQERFDRWSKFPDIKY